MKKKLFARVAWQVQRKVKFGLYWEDRVGFRTCNGVEECVMGWYPRH